MKWYEVQKQKIKSALDSSDEEAKTARNDKLNTLTEQMLESNVADEEVSEVFVESEHVNFMDTDIDEMVPSFSEEPTFVETKIEPPRPTGTISSGTIIHGNIESVDHLIVDGNVQGDVLCEGTLHVNGEIKGDIKMHDGIIEKAIIVGNIACEHNVTIEADSTITGNINAGELSCAGRVKGNLKIDGDLHLAKGAYVEGNVSAKFMQSDRGASIHGSYTITCDEDTEKA